MITMTQMMVMAMRTIPRDGDKDELGVVHRHVVFDVVVDVHVDEIHWNWNVLVPVKKNVYLTQTIIMKRKISSTVVTFLKRMVSWKFSSLQLSLLYLSVCVSVVVVPIVIVCCCRRRRLCCCCCFWQMLNVDVINSKITCVDFPWTDSRLTWKAYTCVCVCVRLFLNWMWCVWFFGFRVELLGKSYSTLKSTY